DLWDTQNQFVNIGEAGGLVALTSFIALISLGFSAIGRVRSARENFVDESETWLLGACLFSYVTAFFGIVYFDQLKYSWFLLLSLISVFASATAGDVAPVVLSPAPRTYRPLASRVGLRTVRKQHQPIATSRKVIAQPVKTVR